MHRSSSSIVVHSEQVLRFPPVEFDRATPLDPHATHALRPCEHSSLLDELIIGTPWRSLARFSGGPNRNYELLEGPSILFLLM